MRRAGRTALVLGLTLILSADACAQWQVVYLHPEGARSSNVVAAAGTQQGGRIEVLGDYVYHYHPVIWNASGQDYVDLLPDGWRSGVVYGMDGPWQVGYLSPYSEYTSHGVLWHGSAETAVLLTPPGFLYSVACDVKADQQVGYVGPSGPLAALWHGSAESFVDLHPPKARWSEALATDGVRQAGRASFPVPGEIHAVLWEGSAESFIDMNPEGARESRIVGMADGVQVGWGLFGTVEHAVLWRGSPESFVDMHPSQGYTSRLYDTTGTIHAGYVNYTGWAEAGIWTGENPESFENLHVYLSADYFASAAYAVSPHKGRLYVAGSASHTSGQPHAVLWMRASPHSSAAGDITPPERMLPWP
ncbi:MAG TPA: hypothetical protein VM487_09035 [Phycisphaerae bacterium]|nr:hypothetical protein [Phycisphaerae bacterium]